MNGGAPKPRPPPGTCTRPSVKLPRPIILCGDYDRTRAEAELQSGLADLIAFGRPFVSNPDLPERLRTGAGLAAPDPPLSSPAATRATSITPCSKRRKRIEAR
jgi:N-ethylmaleimide reductase